MLAKDFAFFNLHREEYLREHAKEYAVVENELLVGFFPDEKSALMAMKDHSLGTFLVKQIILL